MWVAPFGFLDSAFKIAPQGTLQLNQKAESVLSAPQSGFWRQRPSPGLPASSPNPSLKGNKVTPGKLPAPNAGLDAPGKAARPTESSFSNCKIYLDVTQKIR